MAMMKGASINTAVEGTHGILETEYIEAPVAFNSFLLWLCRCHQYLPQ
jgi:hypothetical protein